MSVRRPPGPRDNFFGLRLAGRIRADLLGFYERLRRQHGDVVYMRLGPYQDYTFFHPADIHQLLVAQAKHFVRVPRPIQVLRQWNGQGLLIAEGPLWQRLRRLAAPAFQPKRLAGYAELTLAASARRLARWAERGAAFEVDFEQDMTELAMDIIARAMFDADITAEAGEITRAVRTLSDVAVAEMMSLCVLPDWLPLRSKRAKRRAMRTIDELAWRFIRQRRAAPDDRGDLLSTLLRAVDEEGDGGGLTDEQARDQCVTFFLAGHDTTAAGLTWIGWALAAHPEVAARAAAEVDAALGGRPPSYADLRNLPFVECVVKESLRVYPPAVGLFARQATREVEIGGWKLPAGAVARVMLYVTQRDERWFPAPEKFDPERFLPPRGDALPPCAFMPFGAGPRACVGQSLAMMEMTLVAARLLQHYRLAPAPNQIEPRLDVKMSLRPIGGLRLRLEKRADAGL